MQVTYDSLVKVRVPRSERYGLSVVLIGPNDLVARAGLDGCGQPGLAEPGGAPFESLEPDERDLLERALDECRMTGEILVVDSPGSEPVPPRFAHVLVPVPSSHEVVWIMRTETASDASSGTARRAEVLLQHSREVLTLLDRSFRVVYRSPTTERPLGYADGLLGRSALEILHPDDRQRALAELGKVLERPGAVGRAIVRAEHADGSWRVLDAIATNLLDRAEVGAILLAYRDVTEEHQAEDRLLAASRLASIGTLAAGVGHEINNPLTYVLGNLDRVLELILAPGASADPRATVAQSFELIAEARDGAQRIAEIVADLKLLSGPERDELVAVDVDAAVERALAIVATQLVSRGRVTKKLGKPPPAVAAEARLVQAVINLLLNAAQALPNDGTSGEIEIGTTSAVDEVVVSVSDTGAGIPESVRRQIFEPHFTTKRTSGGTGLGLWVVRRIIEAFGGRVDVDSEPGRGSTFRLILRAAEAGAPLRATARLETPVTTRGRVLVVDDERLVAAALGRALETVHLVSIATSGQEVLDRMDRGERWDVVVSDVIMPGMTGLELRDRVEKRVPALGRRFVFISGGGFDRDIRDALDALGLDYLTKPPDLSALRAAVARLISNLPK